MCLDLSRYLKCRIQGYSGTGIEETERLCFAPEIFNPRDSRIMSEENLIPLRVIDPKDENNPIQTTYNDMVNSFLALANQHWQTIEIEGVSSAIREAAARFNAFEADYKSGNLAGDRQNAIDWFGEQYGKALADFLDELIARREREGTT